jgi:hypothetical protein
LNGINAATQKAAKTGHPSQLSPHRQSLHALVAGPVDLVQGSRLGLNKNAMGRLPRNEVLDDPEKCHIPLNLAVMYVSFVSFIFLHN